MLVHVVGPVSRAGGVNNGEWDMKMEGMPWRFMNFQAACLVFSACSSSFSVT